MKKGIDQKKNSWLCDSTVMVYKPVKDDFQINRKSFVKLVIWLLMPVTTIYNDYSADTDVITLFKQ